MWSQTWKKSQMKPAASPIEVLYLHYLSIDINISFYTRHFQTGKVTTNQTFGQSFRINNYTAIQVL